MRGIVEKKKIDQGGNHWAIIRGEDGKTYRCDKNGYRDIATLTEGKKVSFRPHTPQGKQFAMELELVENTKMSDSEAALIKDALCENIERDGYFTSQRLGELFRSAGLSDFSDYASGAEELIETYYADYFAARESATVRGGTYRNVITPSDGALTLGEWDALVTLRRSADYVGCLLSDSVHKHDFSLLARSDIKVVELLFDCAGAILDGGRQRPYSMNLLQRELIRAVGAGEFKRKCRQNIIGYPRVLLDQCLKTAAVSIGVGTAEHKESARLLERLNAALKPTSDIAYISERLGLCFNELTPATFMIRAAYAYRAKSAQDMKAALTDYCQYIRLIKGSKYNSGVNFEKQMAAFVRFINKLGGELYLGEVDIETKIGAFSLFVEVGCENMLKDPSLGAFFSDERMKVFFTVLGEKDVKAEDIRGIKALGKGGMLLLERCCSSVWNKRRYEVAAPEELILLFSSVMREIGKEAMDEIIRYCPARWLQRKEKEIALVSSLPAAIGLLDSYPSVYGYVCYVMKYVLPYVGEDNMTHGARRSISEWEAADRNYYEKRLAEAGGELGRVASLFSEFRMNRDRYMQLQKLYTKLLFENIPENIAAEGEKYLEKALSDGAFDAFLALLLRLKSEIGTIEEKYASRHFEALLELQLYQRAIQLSLTHAGFTRKEQQSYAIRAIAANFSKYGISAAASLIFNESFTEANAIAMLESNFTPDDTGLIASLIALYSKNDDIYKALYLNTIYKDAVAPEFAYLYSELNSRYGRLLNLSRDDNGQTSHYVVLGNAFSSLSQEKLWDFLLFASKIPVVDYDGYIPTHVFQHFFDELLKDPRDVGVWKRQMQTMMNCPDLNSNMICAAAPIMMEHFGMPSASSLSAVYRLVMEKGRVDELPESFLYSIARYVTLSGGEESLVRALARVLSSKEAKGRLIDSFSWHKHRKKELKPFLDYLMKQLADTEKGFYYTVLTALSDSFDLNEEIMGLMRFSSNKDALIATLARNYADGGDEAAAYKYLDDALWRGSTYRETAAHEALKLVYSHSGALAENYPMLFADENEIPAVKQDVASILSLYPDSRAFREFDRDTSPGAHKFAVFSILCKVYYDEESVNANQCDYGYIVEKNMEAVFVEYMRSVYHAQLYYNSSYEYFYKQWRYHKLLILEAWELPEVISDAQILRIAAENGHEQFVSTKEYAALKESLGAIIGDAHLTADEKKMLLYCIAEGNMKPCLSAFADSLRSAPDSLRAAIRFAVNSVDYRDVNSSIFDFYNRAIRTTSKASAEKRAELSDIRDTVSSISEIAALVVDRLIGKIDDTEAYKLFEDIAVKRRKPGECLNAVVSMDKDRLERHSDILLPIAAARQLASKIVDVMRRRTVNPKAKKLSPAFNSVAPYLSIQGYANADAQLKYLLALELAVQKDTDRLKALIGSESEIFLGLPLEWEDEVARLKAYALSDGEEPFTPDDGIGYRTGLGVTRGGGYIDLIKAVYAKSDTETEGQDDKNIRARLFGKASEDDDTGSPETRQLDTAILALESSSVLSTEKKLEIIADIVSHCNLMRTHRERLAKCFDSFFGDIDIDLWIRYSSAVADMLRAAGRAKAADEILSVLGALTEAEPNILDPSVCSVQRALECYCDAVCPEGSVYVKAIKNSIESKKYQLKLWDRLRIGIENGTTVTDGCVYYYVENISDGVVNISEDCSIRMTVYGSDATYVINSEISKVSELRPEWMTGGCENIEKYVSEDGPKLGRAVRVKIEIEWNSKLISSDERELVICAPESHGELRLWDTDSAVSCLVEGELVGREDRKDKLRVSVPAGKTAIFGPSRIGKTSILNWVRNVLATDKENHGNVITALYGGGEIDKDSDYRRSFKDERSEVPYHSDDAMAEYLLIDTVTNALSQGGEHRLTLPSSASLSQEVKDKIISAAKGDGMGDSPSVSKRYRAIDKVLKDAGLEIWILLDEFQTVVEKWNIKDGYAFTSACGLLNKDFSIKLVVCGSDDLLRQMVLNDESVWRTIFKNPIGVGPFTKDDFYKMIDSGSDIGYSDAARRALFEYTGGIPLYGKELSNQIFEDAIAGKSSSFEGRATVYTADVAKAAEMLLHKQNEERNVESSVGIRRIYDAVTKGLSLSDMMLLRYIALWLKKNPDCKSFSKKDAFAGRKLKDDKAVGDLLNIAAARMILEEERDEFNAVCGYKFRTLFYFNAFLGSTSSIEELESYVFDLEAERLEAKKPEVYRPIGDIIDELCNRRYTNSEAQEFQKGLPNILRGAPNQVINVAPGATVVQNYVHYSIENMSGAISNILGGNAHGKELLEAFAQLPRLSGYYEDESAAVSLLERAAKGESEAEEELSAVTDKIVTNYQGALVGHDSDDFCIWQTLGFESKEDYDDFASRLDSSFVTDIFFAAKLEWVFSVMRDDDTIDNEKKDFSPVCIMYCKIVEKMLKRYHADVYKRKLPDASTEQKYWKDNVQIVAKFGDLATPEVKRYVKNKITMGAFLYPINPKYHGDDDVVYLELGRRAADVVALWKKHAAMLRDVTDIRNDSAHGVAGRIVGESVLMKLKKALFEERGLRRIAELH